MSPYLLKRLYAQLKRVITHPLALADRTGKTYAGVSDFANNRRFTIAGPITLERTAIAIEGNRQLIAIPIYGDDRFFLLVIVELSAEDQATIEVITSLAELIIEQFIAQFKPRPDAVDLLLTRMAYKGSTIDREELDNQITALGYQLESERVVMAVELGGFWDNYLQTVGQPLGDKGDLIAAKKSDINNSLSSFFTKNQDNIIGYIGTNTFLILKDLHDGDYQRFCQLLSTHYQQITDPLKNVHITEVTIGLGLPAGNLGGVLESVQQALQVLKIGKRVVGANQVHRYESLGALPLILTEPGNQKLEFAHRLLDQLADEELSTTLEAFLAEDLNLTQTAQRLKIHRNTVIYRLNKITEKLDQDPRNFASAVELYLALLFRKYFG
jgi:sugar diacid utilization regulator